MLITDSLKHVMKCLFIGYSFKFFFPSGELTLLFAYILLKVRLVDAGFVWTEPHSKRLKVKLTIQKEVSCTFFLSMVKVQVMRMGSMT
jgi:hypothetical protein